MPAIWAEAPAESSDLSSLPLDWNGPVDRLFDLFPESSKSRPVVDLLKSVVDRYPARTALFEANSSLSYADLWQKVGARATQIADATRPGALVGIAAATSNEFCIAMLACLATGRPFVAFDPHNPSEWIARAIGRTRPALLLVLGLKEELISSFVDAPRIVDLAETLPASGEYRPQQMDPDAAACILFTSGSTGDPKGIVNSQRNLLQRVAQSINSAHINRDDRFLTLASLSTIVGVRDVLTALLAGASIYLLDTQRAGASDILRVVRDQKISILFSFPALLRSVVRGARDRAPAELRLVRVGGDTTLWSDIALLRAWLTPDACIQSIYAATEAPMMQWFVSGEGEGKLPIGYALPGNELTVCDGGIDENDGAGEIGELVVRSPYVALGEWADGLRKLAGIDVDASDPRFRMLKTGDLVRRRADGFFERIGRKDRQVKIRGVRVELDGVEAAIRRHRSVRDVGVLARTDGDGTTRLVAYVESREPRSDELFNELRDMLSGSFPPHMMPWRYYALSSIPRLSNSKLDVQSLRSIDLEKIEAEKRPLPAREEARAEPPTLLEKTVASVWQEILSVVPIRANDDFFDLGGDSLRAIALMADLEKILGREIPFTLINQAPKFAAFCAALDEKQPTAYSPLVIIKPGRGSLPLFMIHGAGGSVMELFTLGRSLKWSGPVLGIQARGLNDGETPHRTVEEMSEEYLAAIKARQPVGPYLLCGYSFGGLVAFEIARKLVAANDAVAFLGLLDTLPPGNHVLRSWTWLAYLLRDLRQRVFARNGLPLLGWTRNSTVIRARAVAINALRASATFRPLSFAGELTFFEPAFRELGLPSLASRWRRYAASMRQYTLPGRHLEMLSGSHAEITAAQICACLESVTRRDRAIESELTLTCGGAVASSL